ncbi:acyl-CoA thioesterase [Acidimangrovimonas sediminis]|uniref:acyl-CoA thioesterase n=1 Tax=Acidimangrovimonas sediminis TaxID=2056283 RepID=UPI000C801457|nr:acyl-CoA thioesterase [Acidimangrovimonas sediminis]
MSGEVFRARYTLRFGQCDPAGIAFFPRLIEMINWVVEDWFAGPIGQDFATMHMGANFGVPAAALSVDFVGPARLGEVLAYDLRVAKIGTSSITFDIRAAVEGGAGVLRARHTIVACDLSGARPRPRPIDDAMRARMAPFLIPETGDKA